MIGRRLLLGGSGATTITRTLPASWNLAREASNPVIDVANNPSETVEQYNPGIVRLPSGTYWCYVKGQSRIYAWSSSDGVTFSLANGGAAVIAPTAATWDSAFALEPIALYDSATSLIHVWYKGTSGADVDWSWGHATAPGSTPTVFTKDAANPILTGPTVSTAVGASVTDLGTGDVVVIGTTFHFYGYALYSGVYHLIHATGTTFNNPTSPANILTAGGGDTVVETPAVFEVPGMGLPLYAMFYARGTTLAAGRTIRVGTSSDGATWNFSSSTNIIAPTSGWEANSVYSGHWVKENASPWLAPVYDGSSRLRFYYSGYTSVNGHANVGLAYFTPSW